jgi:molybdenum ABC transporter molybdate-binding protein
MALKPIENLNFNKSQKYVANASIYLSQSTSKLVKFKPSFNLIKHKSRIVKEFLKIFAVLLFFEQNSLAATSRNLIVLAEPNMVLAMTKISRLYSQKSNTIVSVNFSSSTDSITNIDSGEPSDVFISAHLGLIGSLHQKGLIDIYNTAFIAKDELVLVAQKTNPNLPKEMLKKDISLEEALKIINQSKSALILDFEGNSSGKFGGDFVRSLNLKDLKLFKKLAEDKSPILSIVKSDPTQYAILLASQVKNDSDLIILARKKSVNIFYQALVIAGDNMEVAREFLRFLKTAEAKKAFQESGFIED